MDITKTIANNLSAWMAASPALDTLKKVAARSGVGFGTVRRARNGDGNTTIQNLTAIARAFGRTTEDLLRPCTYEPTAKVTDFRVSEPMADYYPPMVNELIGVVSTINDRGLAELIGRAKEIALAHPKAKANRAS